MKEQALSKDEVQLRKKIADKAKAGELQHSEAEKAEKKRRRWDQAATDEPIKKKSAAMVEDFHEAATPAATSLWEETPGRGLKDSETPGQVIWDPTPVHTSQISATPGSETPGPKSSVRRNRWDETPKTERELAIGSNSVSYTHLTLPTNREV